MVNLSHLDARSFVDVARIADAPLVATHSDARALCPHARNPADRQPATIRDRDGMVGINFVIAFPRPDGRMESEFELDIQLRHLNHLLRVVGEARVGFGSDFDGVLVPDRIGDCEGLVNLLAALRSHGVDGGLMARLACGNWPRVLRKAWGA